MIDSTYCVDMLMNNSQLHLFIFTTSVNKEEQIVAAATLIVSVRLLIIWFSHLCSFHPQNANFNPDYFRQISGAE